MYSYQVMHMDKQTDKTDYNTLSFIWMGKVGIVESGSFQFLYLLRLNKPYSMILCPGRAGMFTAT